MPSRAITPSLLVAAAAAGILGCGASPAPPAASAAAHLPARGNAGRQPRVEANLQDLSSADRVIYEARRVLVVPRHAPGEYVLTRNGQPLSELEFRRAYRELTKLDDLEANTRRRATAKNPLVLAAAGGEALVGVGSVTALAIAQPPLCNGATTPGCGKAVLGVGVLALIGGAGLYLLGCEAVKGVDCILDGTVGIGELSQVDAEDFVARYDAALLESLRRPAPAAPSVPEEAPGKLPEERSDRKPHGSGARIRFTPLGLAGTF
jgi:hypothetical protein